MEKEKIAVFDMGGTLRRVNLPGIPDRNFKALRGLYNSLISLPDWKVIILTKVPINVTVKDVEADLKKYDLSYPDILLVCHGSKVEFLKEIKPDLLFEDNDEWLAEGLKNNALCLKVV